MDPISIALASGAILSASGGFVSAVSKYVQSVRAERALKARVRASSFQADSSPPPNDLRGKMEALISTLDLSENDRKVLLSGLQQPSKTGQRQYADKLFAEVSEAAHRHP